MKTGTPPLCKTCKAFSLEEPKSLETGVCHFCRRNPNPKPRSPVMETTIPVPYPTARLIYNIVWAKSGRGYAPNIEAETIREIAEVLREVEREALEWCLKVAEAERRNCSRLASNPPQSAAAFDIANRIRKRLSENGDSKT